MLNGIYQYESYLRDIFKKLDKDNDGQVTKKELEDFFYNETPFLLNQDVNECMKEIDLNNDGVITLDELIEHMRTKRTKGFEGLDF